MPEIPSDDLGEATTVEDPGSEPVFGENFAGFGGSSVTTDGTVDGPKFGKEFYNPKNESKNLAFDGVNGQITGIKEVKHRHIQPRSFCDATMVGLTGNMPYRSDHFFQQDSGNNESYVSIPGASAEFYLPKDSLVVMTWMIGGASSGTMGEGVNRPVLSLRVDGSTGSTGYRNIAQSTHIHPDGHRVTKKVIQRPHRDRVWSGHRVREMSAGWHSVSIVAQHNKDHLVFRTRNFKVIWFPKKG